MLDGSQVFKRRAVEKDPPNVIYSAMHAFYTPISYLHINCCCVHFVHAISTSLIHRYIQYTMYYTYCHHMSRTNYFAYIYLEEVGPHLILEKILKKGKNEFNCKLLKLFMKCSRLSRHHIIISLVLLARELD